MKRNRASVLGGGIRLVLIILLAGGEIECNIRHASGEITRLYE